jgi:hypothetical protein
VENISRCNSCCWISLEVADQYIQRISMKASEISVSAFGPFQSCKFTAFRCVCIRECVCLSVHVYQTHSTLTACC